MIGDNSNSVGLRERREECVTLSTCDKGASVNRCIIGLTQGNNGAWDSFACVGVFPGYGNRNGFQKFASPKTLQRIQQFQTSLICGNGAFHADNIFAQQIFFGTCLKGITNEL